MSDLSGSSRATSRFRRSSPSLCSELSGSFRFPVWERGGEVVRLEVHPPWRERLHAVVGETDRLTVPEQGEVARLKQRLAPLRTPHTFVVSGRRPAFHDVGDVNSGGAEHGCTDARMGDGMLLKHSLERGVSKAEFVETLRREPPDDPRVDRDRSVGPGPVDRWRAGLAAAGSLQGEHRFTSHGRGGEWLGGAVVVTLPANSASTAPTMLHGRGDAATAARRG